MFTNEQLGAIKSVFEPFEERMNKRFDRVDEGFKSHAEQIAKVSEQVTMLEKKVDEGFKKTEKGFEKMDEKIEKIYENAEQGFQELDAAMGPLCKIIKDVRWDQNIMKSKLNIAEENKPTLFMRRS